MSERKKMTLQGAIAVTRFGLGAQPNEIELASKDPKEWLKTQLVAQNVTHFPATDLNSSYDYILEKQAYFIARNRQKTDLGKLEVSRPFNSRYLASVKAEYKARFLFGVETQTPFHERLVRFWSNHFSISGGRTRDVLTAAAHEREAIRPSILGNFYDLAVGAILHPAMLIYLDNIRSIGSNSVHGVMGRFRNKGLNENLAREVLELHTITPLAGYTQTDVTEFAKALTGWTKPKNNTPVNTKYKAVFNPLTHEPGSRTILNRTYFPLGQRLAPAIIRNLCHHPGTAKNIATKLAHHFCSDTPPNTLIERLTQTFIETHGDLKSLYIVLIDSPEPWDMSSHKVKTPDELLVSAARMIGSDNVFPIKQRDLYEGFGQMPFRAPTPEGWPDSSEAWLGPDAILKRIEWANKVALTQNDINAQSFLDHSLGPKLSPQTNQTIAAAESRQQALALALMSPEFQRR